MTTSSSPRDTPPPRGTASAPRAPFARSIAIIGGCGRVGLPLGIAFAETGHTVSLVDRNPAAVEVVNAATMPFLEDGADAALARVVGAGLLVATTDPSVVADHEHIVVVIGTPVDDHLNPDPGAVTRAIEEVLPHLRRGQHLVLRSTVFPGVTERVDQMLRRSGVELDVSFCPERIAEGRAMVELRALPQIVSGCSPAALARARDLFGDLAASTVELEVLEAELAKLFTNTWRYIRFAAANQLFMIANDHGLDFERIRAAMTFDYPRAADLPGAGFAAGPCLFKDTMQLAAFNDNNFTLGHASMMVNEGLPLYVVARLEERFDLASLTVGILGMAFKAHSDDRRSSLSYKLKRLLTFKAAGVLCTDPFVADDPALEPLAEVVARSDLLVIATPHDAYRDLEAAVPVIDIWNLLGRGVRL